ncbi:MAG: hypothetical protein ACKOPT_01415 [Cyanobium sp.]
MAATAVQTTKTAINIDWKANVMGFGSWIGGSSPVSKGKAAIGESLD